MDSDILFLLGMILVVFAWWFKMQLDDTRKLALDLKKAEQDQKQREERVKQLVNRR